VTALGDGTNARLQEQARYYAQRADEYDDWFYRRGRYDRGEEHNARWRAEAETVLRAIAAFAPAGQVLELASGTGLWTQQLARTADAVTAVDASAEMHEVSRRRTFDGPVEYEVADLFAWRPARRYDVVFFGFWLSHVPPDRFEAFWAMVADCLKPDGGNSGSTRCTTGQSGSRLLWRGSAGAWRPAELPTTSCTRRAADAGADRHDPTRTRG
jgi:2-polyprenyl-3-methyl-5-hydroxy-6-metoxy-1,4-benzoquinol methylase